MLKPWKQFFVREVPLSYKYELYYPNTVNNSAWGGFQLMKIVLPEHLEFALLGFILLFGILHWISTSHTKLFTFTHPWQQQQNSWSPEGKAQQDWQLSLQLANMNWYKININFKQNHIWNLFKCFKWFNLFEELRYFKHSLTEFI